jgi:hypothetical protein
VPNDGGWQTDGAAASLSASAKADSIAERSSTA